jgi:hypothetical protein
MRSCFVVLLIIATSCQDLLDSKYQNPDRSATSSIGNFFTRIVNNNRVRPTYWEVSTFINWHIGVYTQSVGFLNGESVYQQNDSYITDRWDDFYRPSTYSAGVMANYRELEKLYQALDETKKEQQEVFLQAANVVLFDQASQMVDLWGDVPFSEAGMLNETGEIVYPKFDDAEDVYKNILEGLKQASVFFSTASLTSTTRAEFSKQDILLNGNVEKWNRYANALRLRLLMRISFVEEEFARKEVLEMLSNPAIYPLPGMGSTYVAGEDDVLLKPLNDYTEDLHNAFTDWTNYPAPYFLVEQVLKPANDPRLKVLFDKYGKISGSVFEPNIAYHGMPQLISTIDQQKNLGNYSVIDSITFMYNSKLPGVVMTSAEVNFLKAEAYQRWNGGDTEQAYKAGIRQSIEFYYYLNSLNTVQKSHLVSPGSAEITAFLETTDFILYKGTEEEKLAKIWTQKWAHFGFLQAVESWAEIRRTKYPKLEFRPSSLSGYELPPARLLYPLKEKSLNKNYAPVAVKDLRDGKIFWDVK